MAFKRYVAIFLMKFLLAVSVQMTVLPIMGNSY